VIHRLRSRRRDTYRYYGQSTRARYAGSVAAGEQTSVSERDRRAAQLAHVLARAVRDGELPATDALRVLRHELRRRNTNRAQQIATRSGEARRVIEKYGADAVPKNDSPDALHADHVYPVTEVELHRNDTLELWIDAMPRLQTVVCVTAQENYRLEQCERQGMTGPAKYREAGVTFPARELPWAAIKM
jgi:hypothetical protein